ncbi:hypothetical protein GBO86_09090 [Pediococcus acidilactici]|nr:hypothetical protein GBO86_09090 [Pediococcus acidilactici]UWF33911.1 hypothetical protein NYR25_00455 [Pediococcus acidilactici]
MDPILLMDKKDQLSFQILSLINRAADAPVNMDHVADKLGISTYKLNTALNAINTDLHDLAPQQNIHINELQKGLWQAQNLSSLVLNKIRLAYVLRSPLLPVFEYLMFYENQKTPNQYLQNTPVSRSVFYRQIKMLNKIIAKYSKDDSKNGQVGQDFHQRLLLFQFYYSLYNGLDSPFPELNDLVDQVLDACQPYFTHPLRLSQKFKLSIFLRVWILRHRNQNYNETLTVDVKESNEQYQGLSQRLQRVLGRRFDLNKYEMSYLYGFLLAKGYISDANNHVISDNFPLATRLTDSLIQWIKDYPITLSINPDIEETLRHDLINVNLQLTSFYIEPTTFVRENSIKFFGKTYPSFDILIHRFLQNIQKEYSLALDAPKWINLYYGYMFALINNIPAGLLKERVYVAVDFSQGDLYTEYVIKSLDAFHHANIIIETNISKDTDIFVSDIYSQSVKQPQLTWEDPPTPEDWTNLGDLIEKVRAKKAFALFNQPIY